MSQKLHFEEAFNKKLKNIPSPDEEVSWQKMSKLLDDNNKPKPFGLFKTYVWLPILAVLLFSGGWYAIHLIKISKEKSIESINKHESIELSTNTTSIKEEKSILKQDTQKKLEAQPITTRDIVEPKTTNTTTEKQSLTSSNNHTAKVFFTGKINSKVSSSLAQDHVFATKKLRNGNTYQARMKANAISFNNKPFKKLSNNLDKTVATDQPAPALKVSDIKAAITAFNTSSTLIPDSFTTVKEIPVTQFDKAIKSTVGVKTSDSSTAKKDTNKKVENASAKKKAQDANKKYFVIAGVGIQQQIPVGGQKIVSAGYNGNIGLSDYIPSVYFRFERDQKWYLQGEFNYGTPQYVNSFSYFKQTKTDTGRNIISSNYFLKKTFYNQLPITFNSYIKPYWSVGIGGMYSWLHGAIAEKRINTKNTITQTETNSIQLLPIKGYTDSFLYRSQTYLLLQSDFQWRRFSLGLKYARDLQPYIKYTLPDGAVEDKRNWSLEIIFRFRLWKSAKF